MIKLAVARWIATANWIGLTPFAPGTMASVLAAATFFMMRLFGHSVASLGLVTIFLAGIGWWASGIVATHMQQHDPALVVIDEWVAVWLLCLALPFSVQAYAAGVILFRLYDISKIWPVSRAETLSGAAGIMIDDIVAALMALASFYLGQMLLSLVI